MSRKTFQVLFVVVMVLTFLPLIFPLFSFANRPTPIVMGLPFNFFWVILWIVIAFVAVLILYMIDPDKKNGEG